MKAHLRLQRIVAKDRQFDCCNAKGMMQALKQFLDSHETFLV
jgi:hypothetical protein